MFYFMPTMGRKRASGGIQETETRRDGETETTQSPRLHHKGEKTLVIMCIKWQKTGHARLALGPTGGGGARAWHTYVLFSASQLR